MKLSNSLRLTLTYSLPFVAMITVLFLLLRFWEQANIQQEQTVELRETAITLVQQVILARMWNANHGGVYVEINAQTKPNPYLVDPERDIVSLSGKRYTKINPAYMTRQLAELSQARKGYYFRMVSLRPLNPANRPDTWEADALRAFDRGGGEQTTVAGTGENRSYRLVAPLITEQACLRCHARQGYRVGDVRGGISVSIPMRESDTVHGARSRAYLIAIVALWLVIATFIFFASWFLSRKVTRVIEHEIELGKLKAIVELAGAAAHEIRQPLTVVHACMHIIRDRVAAGENPAKELDIMIAQCSRINEIISKMQNITEYKTKPYVGDTRIVDLDVDSKKFEP